MNKTQVLAKKPVLSTHHMVVSEFQVESKGKIHEHTNVEVADAVFVFPLTETGEIYLVTQYRYLIEEVALESVAGMVENDEDPLVAAKRELREELGITAKKWKKLARIERGASFIKHRLHVYLAQDLQMGENQLDEFEEIEMIKMPLTEAIEKVITGEIHTSGTVIGLLLLDHMKHTNTL